MNKRKKKESIMSEMKSYLFFEDFPPMEKGFYFFVEKATMKKPLILSQELQKIQEVQEGEIFTLKIGDSRKLEVQKTNDSTSKIILKEIQTIKYMKIMMAQKKIYFTIVIMDLKFLWLFQEKGIILQEEELSRSKKAQLYYLIV